MEHNNREKLFQKMDENLASLMSISHKLEDDSLKKVLVENTNNIQDAFLRLQMNKDLDSRKADKRIRQAYWKLFAIFDGKHIRTLVFTFIAGLLCALIPTLIYINNSNAVPKFYFVPNSIGYAKPKFVQMIKNQEMLDIVKKSNIRDSSKEASIGAVVKMGKTGLTVWSKEEVSLPTYHLKDIGPQQSQSQYINGYHFIPDTRLDRDPLFIDVLLTQLSVDSAKKEEDLLEKEFAEVGAAIYCPQEAKCFVIPKANLENDYSKVIRISDL